MRKRFAANTLPALTLAVVSMMAAGCSGDARVSKAIGRLVDERKSETIRLADATSFEWDQVYLFGPYRARRDVCTTLGIQEKDCERQIRFESQDDGEMSIAFLANGRLVHYVRHSRANGDFTPVPAAQPLSRDHAVFRRLPREDAWGGPAPERLVLEGAGVSPQGPRQ